MKRESVIVTNLLIERPKQIKLFQIRIPRDVENIIGVEMDFNWIQGVLPFAPPPTDITPFTYRRNINLGEVKLQSYEKANIFYTGQLAIDENIAFADFTNKYLRPRVFSHQYQRHEDVVMVSGKTTIIQGVYRDKLYDQVSDPYKYMVNLFIWTAAKEDQSNL